MRLRSRKPSRSSLMTVLELCVGGCHRSKFMNILSQGLAECMCGDGDRGIRETVDLCPLEVEGNATHSDQPSCHGVVRLRPNGG